MVFFSYLANPERFTRFNRYALPISTVLAIIFLPFGLIWGVFFAPPDYLQQDAARIIYIHVPISWLSLLIYLILAISASIYWIWRHSLADIAAQQLAILGLAFTFLSLATGAIWGRPSWGVFWEWDPRLTSQLVQFFIYAGLIALRQSLPVAQKSGRLLALLAIFGLLNLFIVKFSVDIWNSQHQAASVVTNEGPKIHPDILWPLLVSSLGFHFLFAALLLGKMQISIWKTKEKMKRSALSAKHIRPVKVEILQ